MVLGPGKGDRAELSPDVLMATRSLQLCGSLRYSRAEACLSFFFLFSPQAPEARDGGITVP